MVRKKSLSNTTKISYILDAGPCCDASCELANTNGLSIKFSPNTSGEISIFICEAHALLLVEEINKILQ